jgi:hypothetical protein
MNGPMGGVCTMLMAVKSQSKSFTDHLVDGCYVHVIRRVWVAFNVVMPHTHQQVVVGSLIVQCEMRASNGAIGYGAVA